jgi:hypothetical protein
LFRQKSEYSIKISVITICLGHRSTNLCLDGKFVFFTFRTSAMTSGRHVFANMGVTTKNKIANCIVEKIPLPL